MSVILSTRGGGHAWQGVCMAGWHVWPRDVHGRGGMHGRGCAWQGGVYMGGHAFQGSLCGGGHVWQGVHAGETTTEAGGTHPTGMHSC